MSGSPVPVMSRASLSLKQWRLGAVVFLLGMGVTAFVFWLARERERGDGELKFRTQVSDASSVLWSAFSVPLEVALHVPAFLAVERQTTNEDFERFTGPAVDRHASIAALEWAPWVLAEDRAAFERELGRPIVEPGAGGRLQPVSSRSDYFPIQFMQPQLDSILGLDIAFEPERRRQVDAAIHSGKPVCSPRFQLVEDAEGVHSVAIYAPVFEGVEPGGALSKRKLRGMSIALFRIEPVIVEAFQGTDLMGLGFALVDESAPIEARFLYQSQSALFEQDDAFSWEHSHQFLDRSWKIVWRGDPRVFAGSGQSTGILFTGFILSLLAAGVAICVSVLTKMRRQIDAVLQLGNYTLLSKLGEGGMGAVYLARHSFLRRPTAIKLIRPDAVSPANQERFEREVQYTSELAHPNTIQIFDYGRTPSGIFYYAMEYLEGITLEDLVRHTGPIPEARAVLILKQMCGSLAEAHAHGIIHRDLKPDNIMLCDRGGLADFVKVLDFGLVKHFQDEKNIGISHSSSLLGTPLYMAPEAMTEPLRVAPAADVYSMGSILYFLLTGTPVFSGKSLLALVNQALSIEPESPEQRLGRSLHPGLVQLVLECLNKDPEKRPRDAQVLFRRLRALDGFGTWKLGHARAWWDEIGADLRLRLRAEAHTSLHTGQTIVVDWGKRKNQESQEIPLSSSAVVSGTQRRLERGELRSPDSERRRASKP